MSVLCREVVWLLEEVLFRRRDIGFAGSLVEVVYCAVALLSPNLLMAAPPPTSEPLLVAKRQPDARHALACHAHVLTHTFIAEAVGGEEKEERSCRDECVGTWERNYWCFWPRV